MAAGREQKVLGEEQNSNNNNVMFLHAITSHQHVSISEPFLLRCMFWAPKINLNLLIVT